MVARFHYEDVIYQQLLDDELPRKEQKDVTRHLEECTQCQSKLETLAERGIDWSELRTYLKAEKKPLSKEEANKDSIWIGFLEPSERPDSLGRFGRYEILEVLGRGGTGIVMRGYDPSLDRQSAIKVLSPELAASAAARKRFSREAKSAAAVVHEHVVPIQTVDEEHGIPYLVMPVLEGRSLEERVRQQGPLDVKEVLRIGRQIASGLAAAHAQGLVHRDVKPANILQHTGVERVVITDFGLARTVDDASMTQSGTLVGTPQYMSPEQARGEALDARSDLFSLGSVLYFLCVGHSPFRAETTMGVLSRITGDDPRSLPQQNPDIPEWLDQIIRRLLSKDPEDRYQDAAVVEQLLGKWLAHLQDPTGTPRPSEPPEAAAGRGSSRKRNLLLAALGGFALAWAGIFVMLETNKGTLTIQSDSDDVAVRITQGEEVAKQLTVTKGDNQVRLAAGQYVVAIEGEHDGLSVKDGEVTLTRGDEKLVHIVESSTKPVPAGEKMFRNVGVGPDGNQIGVPVETTDNEQNRNKDEPAASPAEKPWYVFGGSRHGSAQLGRVEGLWEEISDSMENPNKRNFLQIYSNRFRFHRSADASDPEATKDIVGTLIMGEQTMTFSTWGPPPAGQGDSSEALTPQGRFSGTYQLSGDELTIALELVQNVPELTSISPKQQWRFRKVAPEGWEENPTVMSSYPADAKLKRVTFDSDYDQMKGRWVEIANSHGFDEADAKTLTIENSRYQFQSTGWEGAGKLSFGLFDRTICFTPEDASSETNPNKWVAGKYEFNEDLLLLTIDGADNSPTLVSDRLPNTWVYRKLADAPANANETVPAPSDSISPELVLERLQGVWRQDENTTDDNSMSHLRGVSIEGDRILLNWTPKLQGGGGSGGPTLVWADLTIEPTGSQGTSRFLLEGRSPDPAKDGEVIFKWRGVLNLRGDQLWMMIVQANNPRAQLSSLPVSWQLKHNPVIPVQVEELFELTRKQYAPSVPSALSNSRRTERRSRATSPDPSAYRAGDALPFHMQMLQGQWTAVSDMGDELKEFNDPLASVRIAVIGRDVYYLVVDPKQNVVYEAWGEIERPWRDHSEDAWYRWTERFRLRQTADQLSIRWPRAHVPGQQRRANQVPLDEAAGDVDTQERGTGSRYDRRREHRRCRAKRPTRKVPALLAK